MTHPTLRALLIVLLITGVSSRAFASTVGLLGSDTMKVLASQLEVVAPGSLQFAQGVDAVRAQKPALVLLVVDAPDGPMPVHDEALELISAARVKFAIVFTGTKEIRDPELFELIIGEVVDKAQAAGLASGAMPVFLDSDSVRIDSALKVKKGLKALHEYITASE